MSFQDGSFRSFAKAASRRPVLKPDEERRLGLLARIGDLAARKLLVEHNLRIVIQAAARYSKTPGIRVPDLVQAGAVGLVKAAERFDPDRGRFYSFALDWIRAYISIEVRAHRFPMSKRSASHSTTKAIEANHPQLLSTTVFEDAVGDVPDEGEDPEARALSAERRATIISAVNRAARSPMEVVIVANRVLAEVPVTHGEIAKEFGVTRQRVHQVEKGLKEKVKALLLDAEGL